MRRLFLLMAVAAAGCGPDDPNKNLKPIPPDAPRPVKAVERMGQEPPADPWRSAGLATTPDD